MAANKKKAGAKAPAGHSRFGASSADRWIECPGSVKAQEGMPNETSIYAAEGTAGHEVAAMCLVDGHDAITFVGRSIAVRDFAERVEITEELADAVQVFLDTIRDDKAKRGGKLLVERNFHLEFLDTEFWGTTDAGRLGTDDVLSIYDLKLGKGKVVEVVTYKSDGTSIPNRQLCYYALGFISTLPKTIQGLIKEVELVIVQPRASHRDGPVRRVRVKPEQLLDYCQDLVDAAAAARSDNPPFKAGDHCGFCRAKGACPTFRAKAIEIAHSTFLDEDCNALPDGGFAPSPGHNGPPPDPMNLTPEQLALLLDRADMLDTWIGGVRAHAEHLARSGHAIPGWKLVDKRAVRRWTAADDDTKAALLFDFGLDESSIVELKLRSPAQVEKLLPKGERASLERLYDKTSSGTKLARTSDPRSEVASGAQSFLFD